MKDLTPAKSCLGIRITFSEDGITLDQEAYIETVLARFNMQDSKATSTPMNTAIKLTSKMSPQTEEELEQMANIPYQEAEGCLMYLAQCTRPDILFAVNQLSRYNTNPGSSHWQAVKHLMRYLRGTSSMKLKYFSSGDNKIVGYSDADWAADADDRKSTSGYIFKIQGGAVSWSCKRQATVALSTCEAEYMALSAAVQEASWWQGLLTQFGKHDPIKLFCDNQSTICIAKNGGYTPRTKHIDMGLVKTKF